jgi:hypothetical protein
MKNLILLLFCLTSSIFADAQIKATKKIDEFTGQMTISSPSDWIQKKEIGKTKAQQKQIDALGDKILLGLTYSLKKDSDSPVYFLTSIVQNEGLECLSQHTGKILLLFENETLEVSQISDTDCTNGFKAANYLLVSRDVLEKSQSEADWTELTNAYLEVFLSQELKKIRIYGTNGFLDFEIDQEYKYVLASYLEAINSEK